MKKITAAAALILGVIASGQAMAVGSTASLTVLGKLVPSACAVIIGSGEDGIKFADIDVGTLNKDKPTVLTNQARKIVVTVNCPEAAKTGIKFSDLATLNKATTAFTLGYTDDNVELGNFELKFDPETSDIDGKAPDATYIRGENGLFKKLGGASAMAMMNATAVTTAGFDMSSTQDGREAAKIKRYGLIVTPTINATNKIGNVREAELKGTATIDVIYI